MSETSKKPQSKNISNLTTDTKKSTTVKRITKGAGETKPSVSTTTAASSNNEKNKRRISNKTEATAAPTTKPQVSETKTQNKPISKSIGPVKANTTSIGSRHSIPVKKTPQSVVSKTADKGKTPAPQAVVSKTADKGKTPAPQAAVSKTVDKGRTTHGKRTTNTEALKKPTISTSGSKKNQPTKPNAVLDTYHNVTVASPPSSRKELRLEKDKEETVKVVSPFKRARPRTRTLDADEIIVLRNDSAKQRIQDQIRTEEEKANVLPIRESVSFEINLIDSASASSNIRQHSRPRSKNETTEYVVEDEPANYSDDFESYESDFETGSSSRNDTSVATDNDGEDSTDSEPEPSKENDASETISDKNGKDVLNVEESEDESEQTQYPVTVIQRDKERERKLDSGNYEMNYRKQPKLNGSIIQTSQHQFDSLDTYSMATSEQLDSGISNYGIQSEVLQFDGTVSYGGYEDFNTKPIFSERGVELMSKIQFDTLTFTLFEMKPISYDIYMQTYGKLHNIQSSTQTHDNRMTQDSQTASPDVRSMWTQHPPQYDLQMVEKLRRDVNGPLAVENCCGELLQDGLSDFEQPSDEYEASLQALSGLRHRNRVRYVNQQLRRYRKPVDFEKLNAFLLTASTQMSKVLNSTHDSNTLQKRFSSQANQFPSISEGCYKLDTKLLDALRVVRIFANSKYNLVITVHECLPDADVYRSDFSNLLMVWSTTECSKPIRLLSTWSKVGRAEICNNSPDIIVCGLRDGSIAMWDLRETYSFCSKLDGHLTHFAATQSIVPIWRGSDRATKMVDLGAVIDIKSFRSPPKTVGVSPSMSSYKAIQFISLNDSGIMTVWTLIDIAERQADSIQRPTNKSRKPRPNDTMFEHSSPWARVKLIQSAICDLREFQERRALKEQSQFDKTKALFQKNIYSDEVLRELNELNSITDQRDGLRFTSIAAGYERLYVCTNRNFILSCSKSLKAERFSKIAINDNRFLFPTALCVLTNEDFLAVGLSNGSVMILNCNQHKIVLHSNQHRNSLTETEAADSPNPPVIPDENFATGKSCAIQNIILNERRSFEAQTPYEHNYESRPTTAACIALITNQKKPYELRVYDQQLLLSGSVLRKHLVQSLELSSDGWRLFALSNGQLRTYDFYFERELDDDGPDGNGQNVVDVAVARTGPEETHLLALNAANEVEVHLLKQ